MRTILEDINDLLEMGVGQTVRLKIIKDGILARSPLSPADMRYVEELSRSFLQNKNSSKPKNEKIIIIGIFFALGLFFVFFIIPLPENSLTPEDSLPEEISIEPSSGKPSTPELAPNPEKKSPDSTDSSSNNEEFSSATVIQSSSSTQN